MELVVGRPVALAGSAAIMWAGQKAFSQEDFAAARAYFEAYVQKQPEIAESHWLLGNALAASKDYEDAINSYNKAIDRKDQPIPVPFNAATHHFNRGNAHYVLQQFEDAADDFKTSQQACGEERSDICLNWGNALIMQGKFGEAAAPLATGSDLTDARSETVCKDHFERLKHLIEHCGAEVKEDRFNVNDRIIPPIVTVQVEGGKQELPELPIIFQGNRGNIGNWGGGEGYSGLMGILVRLEPASNHAATH